MVRVKKFLNILFILTAWTLLGFQKDQVIQLENYFNGRASAQFTKTADNLKFILAPKTQGQILETKLFSSGNYGLKIQVLDGQHKNKEAWVYYKTAKPDIEICEKINQGKCQRAAQVTEAKQVKTTKRTVAVQDPDQKNDQAGARESTATDTDVVYGLGQVQDKLKKLSNESCVDCEVAIAGTTSYKASSYSGEIIPPAQDANPGDVEGAWGDRNNEGFDRCCYMGKTLSEYSPAGLRLCNNGPNKIVPKVDKDVPCRRNWSLRFDNQARQDMHLWLEDSPDGRNSTVQDTFMMFFPRKTIPSIRVVGEDKIMTLPNGEVVVFDKATNTVKEGVLSENGALGFHKSKVSYHGQGIFLKVDNQNPKTPSLGGTDPRVGKTATIQKKGYKACQVSTKELWPDQSENSKLRFHFASDDAFNSFIQSKCGFGL